MKKKQQNTLMNFMGARMSKSGERVNLTLVKGEGESREYRNVSIALENDNKVKVAVRTNEEGIKFAVVAIPFFEENEEDEEAEEVVKTSKKVKKSKKSNDVDTSDLPF